SSEFLWIYRRLVPLAIFAVAGAIALNALVDLDSRERWETSLIFVGLAAFFAAFGGILWFLPGNVVDLDEDVLIVESGRKGDRIPFYRIERVSEVFAWINLEMIEVRLKVPGKFGCDFRFIPKQRWYWQMFVPHPIVVELKDRIGRSATSQDR